jgi:hypothetical protein
MLRVEARTLAQARAITPWACVLFGRAAPAQVGAGEHALEPARTDV